MGRKLRVIGIGKDGTRNTHEVTRKEVKGKCKEKYGNKFWVDRKRSKRNVRKRRRR